MPTDQSVDYSFLHNKAAVAGVCSFLAIAIICLSTMLVICFLRRRRDRPFNRLVESEMTAGEAASLPPSRMRGGNGPGVFSTDAAYRRRERHWSFMDRRDSNNDNSDSWSQYSDAFSHGTFRQSPMTVGGSDEFSSSSYIASTLPEYAERSINMSPPGYSDLSRSQSRSQSIETRSDVAVRNSSHDPEEFMSDEGEKGGYSGQA
jgi:hypothetical protein